MPSKKKTKTTKVPADGAPLTLRGTPRELTAALGKPSGGAFGAEFSTVEPRRSGGFTACAPCACMGCQRHARETATAVPSVWPRKVRVGGHWASIHNGAVSIGCQSLPLADALRVAAASDRVLRSAKAARAALAKRLSSDRIGIGPDGSVWLNGYPGSRKVVLQAKHLLNDTKLHGR